MKKFLFIFLAGCGSRQVQPVEPNDTHMCAAACTRMVDLGCPEGDPLDDGTSCKKFCEITQRRGHALNPSCLAEITSCGEIDACSVNRRGGR